MDMPNNEFGKSNCGKDEARILIASSVSKKLTRAGYLSSGAKKDDQAIKRGGKSARGSEYLTPDAKKAFNFLQHTFIQALIFQHFDLEWHIQIETHELSYAISEVLSQLTLDDLGWWHLIASYLRKIIVAKTWYKTHDNNLLAIVKSFKI